LQIRSEVTEPFPGPWEPEVAVAQIADLNAIWARWTSPEYQARAIHYYKTAHDIDHNVTEVNALLGASLQARKSALEDSTDQPGPNTGRTQSTAERIDAAIIEHFTATDAYAVAVEQSARLDAESKRTAAKKYLEVKARVPEGQKRVTDTEANRAVDADETVLEARLSADIAAAQAKAAKARLDHWEHVIEWGRSVYSRETRADTR
jgi:hypothetical protein